MVITWATIAITITFLRWGGGGEGPGNEDALRERNDWMSFPLLKRRRAVVSWWWVLCDNGAAAAAAEEAGEWALSADDDHQSDSDWLGWGVDTKSGEKKKGERAMSAEMRIIRGKTITTKVLVLLLMLVKKKKWHWPVTVVADADADVAVDQWQ